MEDRRKLHETAVDSQTEEDWTSYRSLRNRVNRRVKEEKVEWQRKKLRQCDGDPSQIRGNILGWLNWKTTKSPTKLYSEN